MTESIELNTAHKALIDWAAKMPDREFLLQPQDGQLRAISFREAEHRARCIANALGELGLQPGDKIAILAKNCAEWMLADFAIAMAGMISVPIYPTAGAETIAYVIEHSGSKAMFVGKLDDPDAVAVAIPASLPTIAFPYPTVRCRYHWNELLEQHEPLLSLNSPAPGDAMTILYTSGSTGRPKGVVISYRAYIYGCTTARETVGATSSDRTLSYLPLAHVTARTAIDGPCIYSGARIYFVESLESFAHDLKAARPTAFASVPRLWVKFQSGIHERISPKKLEKLLAIPIVGGLVARKIRTGMGFANGARFGSGSAPISPNTLRWYRKLGIRIGEGWGMTETSGLSCGNVPFQDNRIGTIGVPVAGTELKLSEQGELLIRCPGLFTEYYKQPELTRESFTSDGFFRTGDKAEWDQQCQAYRITGRVKDIFKTAKGKYVVPAPIEARLTGNPLLEQICVIGAGLPAPIGVVVLTDAAQKLSRDEIQSSLEATRLTTNEKLESHERLSNLFVANDAWTTENNLLTPTLKIKREQLEARYLPMLNTEFDDPIAWEKRCAA